MEEIKPIKFREEHRESPNLIAPIKRGIHTPESILGNLFAALLFLLLLFFLFLLIAFVFHFGHPINKVGHLINQ